MFCVFWVLYEGRFRLSSGVDRMKLMVGSGCEDLIRSKSLVLWDTTIGLE